MQRNHDSKINYNFVFVVNYDARLENGTIVSKSDEGVEFCISNGKLHLFNDLHK